MLRIFFLIHIAVNFVLSIENNSFLTQREMITQIFTEFFSNKTILMFFKPLRKDETPKGRLRDQPAQS